MTTMTGRVPKGQIFRDLLKSEKPLVLVGAYDALGARLIAQAGAKSLFIGGFSIVGARYGVPDVGLRAYADIAAAVRDIVNACDLPAFVDCDDGYGDVKNVVHTVQGYERMGVAAMMLEDQTWPKRCGHMAGKNVVPVEVMEAKVRAAVSERLDPATFIFARTDARAVHGLDDAMRRAERYLRAGAEGLFIEAPESVDELSRIGRAFSGVPLVANPLEGGKTPLLSPAEFAELGFTVIPYGITLILHAANAMQKAIVDITSGAFARRDAAMEFRDYLDVIEEPSWAKIQDKYGGV
ncbi:isocitrate lyase/PEP mutase family protein [Pseudorhodoplanes sp.]|uniref:isocitrate lyase/PEP mutase family protein n=1 Tax=Pseudorhodoplanes sp. TaxID=1934341 RepID=UPI002C23BE90|nr:isocitrate lyase/PEP mutase family protein [Pseudorhodoplanes sp.]HWV54334.1 isocitrate lyase/PEP mutase family protein [Pseudorhodoplanes sp.]